MLASFSSSVRRAALLAALAVAGCSGEYDQPGTWRPTGANDENLRAMLVNPRDLTAGTGAQTARGDSGARAVTRLLVDKRRPLLDVQTSRLGGTASAAGDAPLAGGTGAAQ